MKSLLYLNDILTNTESVSLFSQANLENLKLTRVLHIQFIYNQYFNIFNPLIKKQHRNKTIN